jgi:hypothetical protein
MQFGSMVLELDDVGSRMNGLFVGYGAFSKRIINGVMEFEKENP